MRDPNELLFIVIAFPPFAPLSDSQADVFYPFNRAKGQALEGKGVRGKGGVKRGG